MMEFSQPQGSFPSSGSLLTQSFQVGESVAQLALQSHPLNRQPHPKAKSSIQQRNQKLQLKTDRPFPANPCSESRAYHVTEPKNSTIDTLANANNRFEIPSSREEESSLARTISIP